jgi:membrane protease YdiL (CAAX protease family)
MLVSGQDEEDVFWGYRDIAIFLGIAIPCLLGGALLTKVILGALPGAELGKAAQSLVAQFLGYGLLFAALGALLRFEYERPFWRSLGWRWPRVPLSTAAFYGVGLAFAIAMAGALLNTPEVPGPMREFLNDPQSLMLVAFFGVTLGPLCEELAFRGFLQPALVKSLGPAAGILLPGVLFGLLHLPQYGNTWQHGLLITAAGAAFGLMRWISRSTLAATVMHCAYNLTLFLGFFAAGGKLPQS